jgi:hypothetical protein
MEVIPVVKLRTDDGVETNMPLSLLPYFTSLSTMVADIGHLQEETVLPFSNGSGTSTAAELRWLISFYEEYDRATGFPPIEEGGKRWYAPPPTVSDMVLYRSKHGKEEWSNMPLTDLLKLNLLAHYNDCRAAELATLLVVEERLVRGDKGGIHLQWTLGGEENRISVEDVPLWSPQPLLAEYLLRAMPYARRYREVLSFLRSVVPNISPEVVRFVVRPTLMPVMRSQLRTMLVTPAGLFTSGTTDEDPLQPFVRAELQGELVSMASGLTRTLVVTTEGLFSSPSTGALKLVKDPMAIPLQSVACGENWEFIITFTGELFCRGQNGRGQLGVGDTMVRVLFTKVEVAGEAHSVVCLEHATMVITTAGLFSTGYNNAGQLGLGDTVTRTTFQKVTTTGVPLSLACGKNHSMLITTEGLFACGGNAHGQLGIGEGAPFAFTFTRVNLHRHHGVPLSVACGPYHTMLITTQGLFGCGNIGTGGLGINLPSGSLKEFLSVPTQGTPLAVACSLSFTVLLTTEGLFASGRNYGGYLKRFTLVEVPGLPIKEGPEKKRQRLACRLCGTTSALREETLRPDRVFCGGECHRKFHYFDQLVNLPRVHKE